MPEYWAPGLEGLQADSAWLEELLEELLPGCVSSLW